MTASVPRRLSLSRSFPRAIAIRPVSFYSEAVTERWLLTAFLTILVPPLAASQVPSDPAETFQKFCSACHGTDGTGRTDNLALATRPMDFTNCSVTTAEPDIDWHLVIQDGGPIAGLSSQMPAFGDVLDATQMARLVAFIRSFCTEPGWPSGNLNFPRPIFTEKAFPENEVVVLPAVLHGAGQEVAARLRAVYERRIGQRAHVEVGAPLETAGGTPRHTGLGDITVAGKYVLHTDSRSTRLVTGGLEVSLPTGRSRRGLGAGTTIVEPYLAFGTTILDVYAQTHVKLELPARRPWAARDLVYNVYPGRDLSQTGNTWTLGIELNGVDDHVAVTPQVRKGLTRTGALAVAAGVRLPVNQRDTHQMRWVGYLLWEYLEPVRAARD